MKSQADGTRLHAMPCAGTRQDAAILRPLNSWHVKRWPYLVWSSIENYSSLPSKRECNFLRFGWLLFPSKRGLHLQLCAFVGRSTLVQSKIAIPTPQTLSSALKAFIVRSGDFCLISELFCWSEDRLSLEKNSTDPQNCKIRFTTAARKPELSG